MTRVVQTDGQTDGQTQARFYKSLEKSYLSYMILIRTFINVRGSISLREVNTDTSLERFNIHGLYYHFQSPASLYTRVWSHYKRCCDIQGRSRLELPAVGASWSNLEYVVDFINWPRFPLSPPRITDHSGRRFDRCLHFLFQIGINDYLLPVLL